MAPRAPYLGGELQEGDLGGGVGQHHFAPHLCPILQHDALRLPVPAQQHAAHGLGRGEGASTSPGFSLGPPGSPWRSPCPETRYLLGKDVCAPAGCCAGDGLGQGPHAASHIAPGAAPPLQLAHDMVQQHVPAGMGTELTQPLSHSGKPWGHAGLSGVAWRGWRGREPRGGDGALTRCQGCGGCSWLQSPRRWPGLPSGAPTQTSDAGSGPRGKERAGLRAGLQPGPCGHAGMQSGCQEGGSVPLQPARTLEMGAVSTS